MPAIIRKSTKIGLESSHLSKLKETVEERLSRIENVLSVDSKGNASAALRSIQRVETECKNALLSTTKMVVDMLQSVAVTIKKDIDKWIQLANRVNAAESTLAGMFQDYQDRRMQVSEFRVIDKELLALTRSKQALLLAEVYAIDAGRAWATAVNQALATIDEFRSPPFSRLSWNRRTRTLISFMLLVSIVIALLAFVPGWGFTCGVLGLAFLGFQSLFCAVSDLEELRKDGKALRKIQILLEDQTAFAESFEVEINTADIARFEAFVGPILNRVENKQLPELDQAEEIVSVLQDSIENDGKVDDQKETPYSKIT